MKRLLGAYVKMKLFMATVTLGGAALFCVATLAILMHVVAGLAELMAGGALGLLAGLIWPLLAVSGLAVVTLGTLCLGLMGLVVENYFLLTGRPFDGSGVRTCTSGDHCTSAHYTKGHGHQNRQCLFLHGIPPSIFIK